MNTSNKLFEKFGMLTAMAVIGRYVSNFGAMLRWCFTIFVIFMVSAQAQAQVNNATFISQSVPATMVAGQTYNVSVTMRNSGDTTWTSANAYKLGSQNPDNNFTWNSASNRVELGASVAPGQQYTFNFAIKAPATAGTYNFQWRMVREFVAWFGATSTNVAVVVNAPAGLPTISVQRTPSPMVAGQNYTLTWSSTNATAVSYNCTASGTGFAGSANLIANGTSTALASSAWVGFPSTCTWTATGPGGSKSVTETMTTVASVNNAAFISQSVPTTMIAGQTYNVAVTMQNKGTTTWTAAGKYNLGSQNPQDNAIWNVNNRVLVGASVAPGQQYTFNFTVKAPATAGTYNFQWRIVQEFVGWFGATTTNVPVVVSASATPTISVQRTPSPMVAGQAYTLTWSSTNATAVSYNCTASGTGFVGSANLAANGSTTGTALAGWVGFPSNCTWIATGAGGNKTYIEIMTTVPGAADGAVTYFHNDVSGTPMVATNASGNVVWKENYRPYGDKLNNQAAGSSNKLWFAGKPYDGNTGLSYMGARYYDPMLGRFTGIDPVGFDDNNIHSFNRYAYANNNPYKFVDPDGKIAVPIINLALRALAWVGARQAGAVAVTEVAAGVATGAMVPSVAIEGAVANVAKSVTVSKSRFPESAQHIEDAIAAGKANTLTIDRTNAAARRRDSLRGTETKSGLDRDEFPPAMFREGGQGASVRHINPSDNRGAGACIGAQCRGLLDGTKVQIGVVD